MRRRKHFEDDKLSVSSIKLGGSFCSEFSFHPEINRSSQWKPKYDDHHDHKKMWDRMHRENQKIAAKKRMMSREKEANELSKCTFAPKLIKNKTRQPRVKKHTSQEAASLGDRLYEYADKHKKSLHLKKQILENERGQEINFTPKVVTTKQLTINRNKGEVYEDLYNDHKTRTKNIKQKITKMVSISKLNLNRTKELPRLSLTE